MAVLAGLQTGSAPRASRWEAEPTELKE